MCQTQGSISINTVRDAARGQRGIRGSAEDSTLMGGGWELQSQSEHLPLVAASAPPRLTMSLVFRVCKHIQAARRI